MSSELTHLEHRALEIIRAGGTYDDISVKLALSPALSPALARRTVSSAGQKIGATCWDDLKAVSA